MKKNNQLYREFCEKYHIDQIAKSNNLKTLYGHLSIQMKINNGEAYHEPGDELIDTLLLVYLKYNHIKPRPDCPSCFYSETCEFFIQGIGKKIEKCNCFRAKLQE